MARARESLSNGYKTPQDRLPQTPFQSLGLGAIRFSIPTGYLQTYSGKPTSTTGFLLGAVWPDFGPYWLPHQVATDLKPNEAHISIGVSLASDTTSIEFRTDVAKEDSPLQAEPLYGLDHRITPDTPPRNMWQAQGKDVYYSSGKIGLIDTVIQCDFRTDFIGHPQCRQSLAHAGLFLSVSFPKAILSQWRMIDEKVVALVSNFVAASGEHQ